VCEAGDLRFTCYAILMNIPRLGFALVTLVAVASLVACRGDGARPAPATPTAENTSTPTTVPDEEGELTESDFADVIVYTQMTDTGPEIHAVYVSPDNPDIWAITQTPGAAVLPRWSPDLSQIVYLYYEPDARDVDFWIVDVATDGQARPLTDGGVPGVETFTWSPDSRMLAYDAPESDGAERDIYLLDTTTGAMRNLTSDSPAWDSHPAWSPDGRLLAFESDREVDGEPALHNIWVMAVDGSETINLTHSAWEDVLPAWSPDGNEIAFYRWSLVDPEGGPAGVWAVKADGSGTRLVTELPGLVAAGYDSLVWSPDGQSIAFQYGPRDDADVYVVGAEGGDADRIGEPLGHDYAVSWSPESQFLLFCHTLQQDLILYLASPDGRVSEPLLGVGGNCFGEWAPVGPQAGN